MELEWTPVTELVLVEGTTELRVTLKVDAFVCGPLAVHPLVEGFHDPSDWDVWIITHVPTGAAIKWATGKDWAIKKAELFYQFLPPQDPRWNVTYDDMMNLNDKWETLRDALRPVVDGLREGVLP